MLRQALLARKISNATEDVFADVFTSSSLATARAFGAAAETIVEPGDRSNVDANLASDEPEESEECTHGAGRQ